jgi:hypothetical protein
MPGTPGEFVAGGHVLDSRKKSLSQCVAFSKISREAAQQRNGQTVVLLTSRISLVA